MSTILNRGLSDRSHRPTRHGFRDQTFLEDDRDSLNSRPWRTATRYYFGLTAYSFSRQAGNAPKQLESTPVIREVIPQWPQGLRYTNVAGDTLKQISHDGPSTGSVVPIVCDPTALPRDGASYRVAFRGSGSALVWDLTRTTGTRSDTIARNQSDQTGSDETSPIVDGILWRVYTAPKDFNTSSRYKTRRVRSPRSSRGPSHSTRAVFRCSASLRRSFVDRPDRTKQQSPGKLTASKGWGIHTGMNSPTMSASYSYFKSRVTRRRRPVAGDHSVRWEIRFTAAGGKALDPGGTGEQAKHVVDVPFELWNIGINTPDNTADDYRLFPYIMDVDNSASFNLLTKAGTDNVTLEAGARPTPSPAVPTIHLPTGSTGYSP